MRLMVAVCLMLILPPMASAQLRFAQSVVDLGEVRGSLVYAHRFEFVNDSPGPIELVDVRLGCGCLSPIVERRVYRPGEKGTLVMHLRTLGQPDGARTWQAHVLTRKGSADKMHEAAIVIGAKIRNEVRIEPSIIAMTIGTALKQELTITDARGLPMKVVNVLASSPAIKVVTRSAGAGVTVVALEVRGADLTRPRQEETLNIYTDDPNYRHLQVPITLMKAERAAVTATPTLVEIAGVSSEVVRLRGSGAQPVRVERIEADHPGLRCTWAAGPGNDATLRIAQTGAATDAQTAVRVHIGATVLTIPVTLRKE